MRKKIDTVEVIDTTIDVLLTGGWRRGHTGPMNDPFARHCLIGAWCTAVRIHGVGDHAFPHKCFELAAGRGQYPIEWNDDEAEDIYEVIATLLRMRNDVLRRKCK